ncbi:MAG TPA: alpha-glucan family phosphorylase [bacterium]|nr:alpha-glucan family phosphorylase [bacterium]
MAARCVYAMKALHTIDVQPRVPERLSDLIMIAYNLWWSWHPEAIQLFRRMDADLWEQAHHNPVAMLGAMQQERLDELQHDEGFLAQLDRLAAQFKEYRSAATWYAKSHGPVDQPRIVYLSAEYGLTECMPIYSGGLGLLAGDHMKSASELGIPLIGVGLLYQRGYFTQYLNADGWQQERYNDNDFYNMPMRHLIGAEGQPLKIRLEFPRRAVVAQVWDVQVGRVRVILLDTNVPENSVEDRQITAELYGGDTERRIQQEIVLGVGGIRAVQALSFRCSVCHLNEGHSAFSVLERVRALVTEHNFALPHALEVVRKTTVFTTHTPVPAGIDQFPEPMMQNYFGEFVKQMGMAWNDFMALGHLDPNDRHAPFNMMSLALNMSYRANAVSRLHAKVSRRMVERGWPEVPVEEVPVVPITNGVHTRSWISQEMSELFDRYLGPAWSSQPADQTIWERIEQIPDEELWRTHERRREKLVAAARRRLVNQYEQRGALDHEIHAAREALNPQALTIGFARRFAPYKRATLLLRDRERLKRILMSETRPVQLLIAGKAHPHDQTGKDLIREIIHFAHQPELRRRVVFLEDYEISLARSLVQGVDLWLNTPRRPMEACGTSGMKVVFNGGLNASVLDGWWDEAYARDRGWAIGSGEEYTDWNLQDQIEADALYDLLEEEIVPLFYDRGTDNLPRGWIARMKSSMRALCPRYNANRMIREYTERFYVPAISDCDRLSGNRESLTAYSDWKEHVRRHWGQVAILKVAAHDGGRVSVGQAVGVTATVFLGALTPRDVRVELYFGKLDASDQIKDATPIPLPEVHDLGNGTFAFSGTTSRKRSGRYGYSVRVLPAHHAMTNPWEMRLVRWPSDQTIR